MESINIHSSYINVSSTLGNNKFYYNSTGFLVLEDGFYNLTTLNWLLWNYSGGFYKIVLSDNSQYYDLILFANLNDYNNENKTSITVLTNVVWNLSILNQNVYSGWFFKSLKCRIYQLDEYWNVWTENNWIIWESEIHIPITAWAFEESTLYFDQGLIFKCNFGNGI